MATLIWLIASGLFTLWACSIVSCPTPPGYVGHHRYTGDQKQWLVYGLSEGFVSQMQTWNGEDGESTSEEARDVLATGRASGRSGTEIRAAASVADPSLAGTEPPSGEEPESSDAAYSAYLDRVAIPVCDTSMAKSRRSTSFVAYANPFYLGDEYPAADFRRVLVDHLVTVGGRDPVFADS